MIYHFCPRTDWEAAEPDGVYRAAGMAAEGFIHCSTVDQVVGSAGRWAGGRGDLVLLEIAEERLAAPPVHENGFPHLYEPLPVSAVVAVHPFPVGPDGAYRLPAAVRG